MDTHPHPTAEAPPAASSARREFFAGMRATVPLLIGTAPFGLIYGALAISAELSNAATLGMSLFVFAGSSQFIAAGLWAEQAAVAVIVLTTFVVNLRHALYSATLAPHYKHLPQRLLLPLGYFLTDETFAVVAARLHREGPSEHLHWYQLGSALAMYSNWFTWTLIGVLAGQVISSAQAEALGFGFAMSVTFIGIVVPMLKTRPMLLSAAAAGITALIANPLPNKLGLIVAALVGVAVGIIAESALKKERGA